MNAPPKDSKRSPGRRSMRFSMTRGRSRDDVGGGDSGADAGGPNRRRRSRSPFRNVSFKKKGKKKSKRDLAPDLSVPGDEAAAAAAPSDNGTGVYGVVLDNLPAGDAPGSPAAPPGTPPRPRGSPAKAATPGSARSIRSFLSNSLAGGGGGSPAKPVGPPLQVVLLLMDPKTRRFELLQLEFDSDKAVVADVVSQISLSATEESLRTQKYSGVASRDGKSKKTTVLLADFCSANDVILAIPRGMTAAECAKLATPILGDTKVTAMLTPDAAAAAAEASSNKPMGGNASPTGGSAWGLLAPLTVAFLVYLFQAFITSPLSPGDVLAPGLFRSRCGILSILPEELTKCRPAMVKMGDDGVLRKYEGDDLVWSMKGKVCPEGAEGCVDGVAVGEDGRIAIGGGRASITGDTSEPISPWPFALDPKGGGFFF